MNAIPTRAVAVVSIALVVIVATGCTSTPSSERGKTTSASVETSASSAVATVSPATPETSASSATTLVTAAPEPAPTPAPAPVQPTSASKAKLGPKDAAVSWAYLKDMYEKDGYWYVVVDYIQVVGPEETIHFVNESHKLRTFPLSEGVKLQVLKSPGSPDYRTMNVAEFKAFQNKSGDEVVEVTPKGGYAVRLKEWWAP
jgi:hypothetical protein